KKRRSRAATPRADHPARPKEYRVAGIEVPDRRTRRTHWPYLPIGGVLRLSAALLYGSAYLFWGFGSHGHA
ncbi:hypothetical protein, partial [Dietzia maris]